MAVRDDITYKWTRDNGTITVTRTLTGDSGAVLDLAVPNGSHRLPAAFAFTLAQLKSFLLTSDQPVTLEANGTDAVQQVAITGGPTGGTFPLTKGANTTAGIPYNATAAQVQAALVAIASVGAGGVVCTGGPLPATPVVCTFVGANAATPVATMTTSSASLTGGTSPTVAVTSTTTGVAPDTVKSIQANLPFVWDSQGYYANPFAANVSRLLLTNTSGVDASVKARTLASAS